MCCSRCSAPRVCVISSAIPGSTELPLIDALAGPGAQDLDYVLALQEATAVAMADGYAQATGRPAFLNLHTSAGLGNAIGNLTNAVANGSPLVVTAGQQDWRHIVTDPLLSGDLVGLAAPGLEVGARGAHRRRARHDPPTGVPRRCVAAARAGVRLAPDVDARHRGRPAGARSVEIDRRAVVPSNLDALADLLVDAPVGSLAIVAGDEVSASGGVGELVALAEALGRARVRCTAALDGGVPPAHPLYAGMLAPAAAAINAALAPFRRVLAVGGHTFMVYPYTPGSAAPRHRRAAARLARSRPARPHLPDAARHGR